MTGHVAFVVDKMILRPDFLRVLYSLPSTILSLVLWYQSYLCSVQQI